MPRRSVCDHCLRVEKFTDATVRLEIRRDVDLVESFVHEYEFCPNCYRHWLRAELGRVDHLAHEREGHE